MATHKRRINTLTQPTSFISPPDCKSLFPFDPLCLVLLLAQILLVAPVEALQEAYLNLSHLLQPADVSLATNRLGLGDHCPNS